MFEHIFTRQSGHSRQTAVAHYAIDGAFLNRLGPDLVSAYSQASRAWHAFLGLPSQGAAVAVAGAVKRSGSPIPRTVKRKKVEVGRAMQGLQKILGPDARPRSDGQAQALQLVHAATALQPQSTIGADPSNPTATATPHTSIGVPEPAEQDRPLMPQMAQPQSLPAVPTTSAATSLPSTTTRGATPTLSPRDGTRRSRTSPTMAFPSSCLSTAASARISSASLRRSRLS